MKGWKPLPLSLKILFILLLLWAVMSAATLLMPRIIYFFGLTLEGIGGTVVVLLLDVLAPLVFLYAMWERLNWGANFGMAYNGIFIVNIVLTFFLFNIGNAVYFPLIASLVFFTIIYKNRKYFSA